MLKRKKPKVVIDTNVWISFLIGKKLSSLKSLISSQKIQIIISDELITEIEVKLKKAHSGKNGLSQIE